MQPSRNILADFILVPSCRTTQYINYRLLFADLLLIQWMMKNIHANVMQDCNNHKKNHGDTVCKDRNSK
ncbi:hypothetical protein RHORCCE3_1896 [Rickettsia hoogstraalii str. RCCE3]|nr:hypothetical protein RHORCCE3_1896 [Rickettsia hoogstraalii str. RCCE3]